MPDTNATLLQRLIDAATWAGHLSGAGHGDTLQHEAYALERDALRAKLTLVLEELATTDKILQERIKTIRLMPDCPVHGPGCQPHYREWITAKKTRAPYSPPGVKYTHRFTSPRLTIADRFWPWFDRAVERITSRMPPTECDPVTGLRGLAEARAERGQP